MYEKIHKKLFYAGRNKAGGSWEGKGKVAVD